MGISQEPRDFNGDAFGCAPGTDQEPFRTKIDGQPIALAPNGILALFR